MSTPDRSVPAEQLPATTGRPPPEPAGYDVQAAVEQLAGLATEQDQLLARVADQFGRTWPEATRVRRKGLFNTGRVVGVTVRLDTSEFSLDLKGGILHPVVAEAHGGVAISHREVAPDEWVRALFAALSALAGRSDQARQALFGLMS